LKIHRQAFKLGRTHHNRSGHALSDC
jgi:hypothetical protein